MTVLSKVDLANPPEPRCALEAAKAGCLECLRLAVAAIGPEHGPLLHRSADGWSCSLFAARHA